MLSSPLQSHPQAHPHRNLPRQHLAPKPLATQLPRLLRPNIHTDPPARQGRLQRPGGSFDAALVAHHVVQLLADHGRGGEHLVDLGHLAALGAGVGGGDAGVGFAEGGLQDGDVAG